MYSAIFSSLELWHYAAIAFGCYYFGNQARRTSLLARSAGIPIGIVVALLLAAEGCYASEMELGEFVSVEFVRLGMLAVMSVGACSVLVKVAEPIIAEIKKQKARRDSAAESRRENAQRERAAREYAARQEADRPAREAAARKKAEEERRARKEKERAEREARQAAHKREQARRQVLLAYHQCSPKIQEALSWDRLQEYMKTYMSDRTPVKDVVSSGDRIIAIIKDHVQPRSPKTVRKTVVQIIAQFDAERQQLMSSGLSQAELDAYLSELEMRRVMALENQK